MEIVYRNFEEILNNIGKVKGVYPEISGCNRINRFYHRLFCEFASACSKKGDGVFGRMKSYVIDNGSSITVKSEYAVFSDGERICDRCFSVIWDTERQKIKKSR